ncbi:MAG: hypothetical protein PHS49_06040 [Candidatus Gracilibacteria bacterium]|nr:hypothetical protein [Candidatus Gracilibacteria bacterium]
MILAFLTTIIDGLSDIFWTKSLNYGVGGKIHDLLSYIVGFIVSIYFIYNGVDLSKIDSFLVFSTIFLLIIAIVTAAMQQKIYAVEKISSVMPFTNVNKILSIIISFFVFSDVSVLSLLITIIAILIIVGFSTDFRKFSLPKTTKLIYLSEILISLETIFAGYLLFNYNEELYFIVFVFAGIVFLSLLAYKLNEFKTLKGLKKEFWINRYIGAMGWISWFLSLVIIKNLGLSVSILLSFIGIGVTLFLSYLILKDKPSKKDLWLTFIVTLLVGIGYYFR